MVVYHRQGNELTLLWSVQNAEISSIEILHGVFGRAESKLLLPFNLRIDNTVDWKYLSSLPKFE